MINQIIIKTFCIGKQFILNNKMKIRNPFSFKNSSGWKDDATIKEKAFWIGVFVLIGALLGYLTT